MTTKASDFWHQAQVCMSLARRASEPELKQRYEDLAVEYAVKAAARGDSDAVRWIEDGNHDSSDKQQ